MSLFGFDTSDFDEIVNEISSSSVDIFLSKDNKYYHEVAEDDEHLETPDAIDQLLNKLQGTIDVKYIEKEYMTETELNNNDGVRDAITKSVFTTPELVPYNENGLFLDKKTGLFYDLNPLNKTFYNIHVLLKKMGIANNLFMLVLVNPNLHRVNPHDVDNLSLEQQEMVLQELRVNPWFYFRDVARVTTGEGAIPYKANIGNISAHFLSIMCVNYYLEQPRQTGKTVGEVHMLAYRFAFGTSNTNICIFNYENQYVEKNMIQIKEALDLLPDYLKVHEFKKTTDTKTGAIKFKRDPSKAAKVRSLTNDMLNNKIHGRTPGKTLEQARNAGRGGTYAIQQWDEIGFTKNVGEAFASAFKAFSTASQIMLKVGKPTYISLTSTPADPLTPEGAYLFKMLFKDAGKFTLDMFDYSREQLVTYLRNHCVTDFFTVKHTYSELGFSDAWALERKRTSDPVSYRRDILLEWLKEMDKCPYPTEQLDKLRNVLQNEPVKSVIVDNNYTFKFYMRPEENHYRFKKTHVVMSCDVSAGMGGKRDSSTIVVTDARTTKVLATFKANTLDTMEFAGLIYIMITKYFNKAVLVVERNSYGKGILDALKRTDIEPNIYYTPMTDSHAIVGANPEKNGKFLYGMNTVQNMRNVLFNSILTDRLRKYKLLFSSMDIYDEIVNLEEKSNGKIEHSSSSHDDLLMAYLIGLYVLLNMAGHLEREFGIPKCIPEVDPIIEQGSNASDAIADMLAKSEKAEYDDDVLKMKMKGMVNSNMFGYDMGEDPLEELKEMRHKFNNSVSTDGVAKRAELDAGFEGLDDGALDDDGIMEIANKRRSYYEEIEDDDYFGGGGLF